jgi:hypothetical protein
MIEDVDQVPGAQVRDQLVDVPLHPLQIVVGRLVDPEDVHVGPLPGLREEGLDLLADDHGRLEIGAPRQEREGSVDGVVVGDGDIVAADLPAALVDAQGVVVGVARAQELQMTEVREGGVDVEVNLPKRRSGHAPCPPAPRQIAAKGGILPSREW